MFLRKPQGILSLSNPSGQQHRYFSDQLAFILKDILNLAPHALLEKQVRPGTNQVSLEDSALQFDREDLAVTSIHLVPNVPALCEASLDSWSYRYVKRLIDVVVSCATILGFAVPGLVIAAIILVTSRGPIFYREERIGRYGRHFRIWKFRSMYADAHRRAHITTDAENGAIMMEWRMRKGGCDPRVTPVGHFLRKWSLDEVPQFINVLRGDMSLIGPRPIVQSETKLYGDLFRYYVKAIPGLSGLWQVSGRSGVGYRERAELDAAYVQTWNLGSDSSIFFRTFAAVLSRSGAH